MTDAAIQSIRLLDPRKFRDPDVTADGKRRAVVRFKALETLWFNTGTLCNLTCVNCYIESSPKNDRLVYLTAAEVESYLDEIEREGLGTSEIGFTGGEPFMNREIIAMLEASLARGFRTLVLTNAMRPMMKLAGPLLELKERLGERLVIRVSIDHYTPALHELERGKHTWRRTMPGLEWLAQNGFTLYIAGRTCWGEPEESLRKGYARFFLEHGIPLDAADPMRLILFPEMDAEADVPEISEECWDILGVSPDSPMCATSRMVIKRKGAAHPVVAACTLVPYDEDFEMAPTLSGARRPVKLNHPHCARFCVLGGGSCGKS
ncbi:MAG: radical SAM protein [Proteobacteria bacterium]|nr:radical SAM protein [Pseudomonadota bacterium]